MDINGLLTKVMSTEKAAIELMIKETHGQYDEVVNALLRCTGRVIFMGVGKSGHIGKKLAATFSSTGTPSIFVHCTEAIHGDSGMITAEDIAIIISNSGKTLEAVNCLPVLKNIGCVTVAFTSGVNSALANGCEYKLIFPQSKEADHLNLAPTVSSTLTLVLGDAVACTLSELKGFGQDDFFRYHPGGALGAKLSKGTK